MEGFPATRKREGGADAGLRIGAEDPFSLGVEKRDRGLQYEGGLRKGGFFGGGVLYATCYATCKGWIWYWARGGGGG